MSETTTTVKSKKQQETEEYLSKIRLKEVFQGLLMHVIIHQPSDPISYFHEELTKLKKELDETNADIDSTTFMTALRSPEQNLLPKDKTDTPDKS